jgi:hypothetical protein
VIFSSKFEVAVSIAIAMWMWNRKSDWVAGSVMSDVQLVQIPLLVGAVIVQELPAPVDLHSDLDEYWSHCFESSYHLRGESTMAQRTIHPAWGWGFLGHLQDTNPAEFHRSQDARHGCHRGWRTTE